MDDKVGCLDCDAAPPANILYFTPTPIPPLGESVFGVEGAIEPFLSAETSTYSDQLCCNALESNLLAINLGSTTILYLSPDYCYCYCFII